MSNSIEAKALIERYLKARIPFVAINSIERAGVLEILKDIAVDLSLPVYVHTLSRGLFDITTDRIINEDKSVYSAIEFMSDQMMRRQNLTILFTEVPDLSGASSDAKRFKDLVTLANEMGGTIMVLTNDAIWSQLQRLGLIVKVDLPNEDEMYDILKEYIDSYRTLIPIEWTDLDVREVASILAGVTRIEAENVIAALIANNQILKTDIDEVRNSKNRLFSNISGLEKIDVDSSDESVGGLSGLRSWLNEKKVLFTSEKRQLLKEKGLRSPRGILLVGVPGCGKSLSAKSISANWKLPLYRLDFATVQGSYIGQTEQQLRDALLTAENVSPCILWIDEIEKGLSGASSKSDGGVSTRMVGQFLFWLQECKKQVFVVATANDVSMLPSELLRRGRFDELFFVDLPTVDERKEIISMYLKNYMDYSIDESILSSLVFVTEGFTGADLESTIRDLAYRSIANPEFQLTESTIKDAFNNVVPLSQTSPEKIESIRAWGRERAVPASGKPIGEEKITMVEGTKKMRKVLI